MSGIVKGQAAGAAGREDLRVYDEDHVCVFLPERYSGRVPMTAGWRAAGVTPAPVQAPHGRAEARMGAA